MIGNRRSSAAGATVGAVALVAMLSGCAGGTTNPPASPSPASSTTTAAASTSAASDATYSDAQVQQLCSDMQGQLQNWRTVTPTIGKGGLNTIVVTWATQNGINLLELAQNRASIDAATSAACPDVRDGALSALEIPDLASGLVGF